MINNMRDAQKANTEQVWDTSVGSKFIVIV